MGDFEQSKSENGKGNTSKRNRKVIYEYVANRIASEKSKEEAFQRTQQRIAEQGNGKYTMYGSKDRVEGKPYDGNNDQKYPTQDDKQSYHFGYVTHGGRRINAEIYKLEKEGKYDEIMALGYREAELGLTEEDIGLEEGKEPKGLAKYPAYMVGYTAAKLGFTKEQIGLKEEKIAEYPAYAEEYNAAKISSKARR